MVLHIVAHFDADGAIWSALFRTIAIIDVVKTFLGQVDRFAQIVNVVLGRALLNLLEFVLFHLVADHLLLVSDLLILRVQLLELVLIVLHQVSAVLQHSLQLFVILQNTLNVGGLDARQTRETLIALQFLLGALVLLDRKNALLARLPLHRQLLRLRKRRFQLRF